MPAHQRWRQTQLRPDAAHLVLEQAAERLHQLQAHSLRQSAHVVVRLDLGGGAGARLDHVRVERSLRQEAHLPHPIRLRLQHANELAADDLALRLRVGHPAQPLQELVRGIDVDQREAQVLGKRLSDLFGLPFAQQAVVDEDAGQLVAHRLADQGGQGHRVDTATGGAEHAAAADRGAHLGNRLGDEAAHCPGAAAAADTEDEVAQQLLAPRGVRHLGMELHAI